MRPIAVSANCAAQVRTAIFSADSRQHIGALVLVLLAACRAHGPTAPAPEPPAARAGYEVARALDLDVIAADATHVYWATGGDAPAIWRRAHGRGPRSERLLATSATGLTVGATDLFFRDGDGRVRAMAKTGGAAAELAVPDDDVWGLAADGDGVWVGVGDHLVRWSRTPGERRIALPVAGTLLAIDGGDGFVVDSTPALRRVDLARGTIATIADDSGLADASALAVSGDTIVLALSDRIAAVRRAGGRVRDVLTVPASGIAADASGYAAVGGAGVVAQAHGRPPRAIAATTSTTTFGVHLPIAIAGDYAYTIAYDEASGESVLRADLRGSGATLLRGRSGPPTALAASGARVFASYDAPAVSGSTIVELGERRAREIAASPTWIADLIAEGDRIVALDDRGALALRADGRRIGRSDAVDAHPLALHRGTLYWPRGAEVWATRLGGGAPFRVADARDADPMIADDLMVQGLAFDDDAMFLVSTIGELGLVRFDEHGRGRMIWSYPDERSAIDLPPDVVALGGAVYLHDRARIYRVPAAGGAAKIVFEDADRTIAEIAAAGDRLIAVSYDTGTRIVEVPLAGGRPHTLWTAREPIDAMALLATGDRAVYVYAAAFDAVLRIDVP